MLAYRINADGSTTLVGNTSLIGSGDSGTGTGSEVSVSPQTAEGAAIASMVVDGTTYNLKVALFLFLVAQLLVQLLFPLQQKQHLLPPVPLLSRADLVLQNPFAAKKYMAQFIMTLQNIVKQLIILLQDKLLLKLATILCASAISV